MSERVIPDPDEPGAWIVEIDGVRHSWVDPTDPTRLEFDYMRRIADVVDLCAPEGQRRRFIHVGGAAMTLARYVVHTRPTSAQIVLEPDAALTAEVREKVPLPRNSGIKVREIDGRAGIAAMRPDFADVVIVDAFAGSRVPAELVTVEWFAAIQEVLVAGGVLVMNVTDGADLGWSRRVLAGASRYFSQLAVAVEPALLKGHRFGNLVIAASTSPLPLDGLGRRAASAAFPFRWLSGEALTKFVGGAAPFYDGQSLASPPADGMFMAS